jgi:hypothetical protein
MKNRNVLSPAFLYPLAISVALLSCNGKQQTESSVDPPRANSQSPKADASTLARCEFLNTQSDVSSEIKGKIDGSLDTLYKVAKANGDVEGEKKQVIHNLQQNVPISGQDLIQIRAQYLFCAVWGIDPTIDPTKKAELYQVIMKLPNSSSVPVPSAAPTDPTTPSHPVPQTEWLRASLTIPGCGQSGCYAPANVCGPLPAGKRFTGNTRSYIDSFALGWGQWGDGPVADGQRVCRYFIQHSHNVQREVSFEYEVSE